MTDEVDDANLPPEFSELRALMQTLVDASPLDINWVIVVEALLRFSRQHQPPARAWEAVHADLPRSTCDGVKATAEAVLTGTNKPSINPRAGELQAILDLLSSEFRHDVIYDASFTAALIARGIAGAIDSVYGSKFSDYFQARGPIEVVANNAFPVADHNPTHLLGGRKPNSRMTSLPSRTLDRTPRLALGEASAQTYPVMIDYALAPRLTMLGAEDDFRILVSQPNLSLAEFRIEPGEQSHSLRNYGPANTTQQLDLLKAHLQAAVDQKASVVLIPEYCVAETMRQDLADHLDNIAKHPMVVVAGSSEVPDSGGNGVHNEAWVCVPGEPGRGSQKLFPAHLGDDVEGIVPGTFVHVYVSPQFTFAVLICRDSMSEDLLQTLAALGVNLLLVPSFSNRTGTIHSSAASLAGRSQAFVAVGCAPAIWATEPADAAVERSGDIRKEASFVGPYEAHPALIAVPDPSVCGPVAGRGAWLFSSASRTVEWLPIQ